MKYKHQQDFYRPVGKFLFWDFLLKLLRAWLIPNFFVNKIGHYRKRKKKKKREKEKRKKKKEKKKNLIFDRYASLSQSKLFQLFVCFVQKWLSVNNNNKNNK